MGVRNRNWGWKNVLVGMALFLSLAYHPFSAFAVVMTSTMTYLDADSTTWVDISSVLPYGGTFDNGTIGWTSTASGGGGISSYTTVGTGWIGLTTGITVGGTAQIQTWNGNVSSILDISTVGRLDMILASVYMKTNLNLLGTFSINLYGAYTTQPLVLVKSASLQADTGGTNYIYSEKSFNRFDLLFVTPESDFYKIWNLSMIYSVTAAQASQVSEIQVDQVKLYAHRAH